MRAELPIKVFFAYAVEDEKYQQQLQRHLSILRKNKLIDDWSPSNTLAGEERKKLFEMHFDTAQIILFLVSADFISSELYPELLDYAMERHRKDDVKVIPILIRAVNIDGTPLKEWQMLPRNGKAITLWKNKDEGYAHLAHEIKMVIHSILGWDEISKNIYVNITGEKYSNVPCPYLGFKPYSEEDAHLFFGRETYINDLLYRLSCNQQLLIVIGPTSSGKTSAIQAGLIPRLRKGSKLLPRSLNWEIVTFVPVQNAISHLLFRMNVQDVDDLIEGVTLWKRQHPKRERLVIIIDQFEDLFRLCSREEQKNVMTQLWKLVIQDLATLIIAMSDIYYSDLAEYTHFIEFAEPHISNILPLRSEEIMDVVTKPAQIGQLYFEDHLAERIVDDTMRSVQEPKERRKSRQSSVLPLVSVCMEKLWEHKKDNYISFEAYEKVGEVTGALTQMATDAFNNLGETQKIFARRILTDLVAIGDESEGRPDYRKQKALNQLFYDPDEIHTVQEVVNELTKAHLLETQLNNHGDVDVALIHESLLREWSLLRHWLHEDRLFLIWYQRFDSDLQAWLNSSKNADQRDSSCLLHGKRLVEAQQWRAEQPYRFSNTAREFIDASDFRQTQKEQEERARQAMQTRQQIEQARRIATKALLLQEQEPHLLRKSLLLAVEALRRHHCVEADQALRQGLALLPEFQGHMRLPTTGQHVLFSGNGDRLATASVRGFSWISNIGSSEERTESFFLDRTRAIALSYDGKYLLAGASTGIICFINIVQEKRVAVIRKGAPLSCIALTQGPPYATAIGYDTGEIEVYEFVNADESDAHLTENDLARNVKLITTFRHSQAVSSLSFSHDDCYFVSGGLDGTVSIWSRKQGEIFKTWEFQSPVRSAIFSSDDTSIAICGEDGRAFVWQWQQVSQKWWQKRDVSVRRIPLRERIQSVTFGPSGNRLITLSASGLVKIWKVEDTLEEVQQLLNMSSASSLSYHQRTDWLAIACDDGNVRIYNIVDGTLKYCIPHSVSVSSLAFSSQKPYIVTADSDGCVWTWKLQDGNVLKRFRHSGKIARLFFDQDKDIHLLRFTLDLVYRAEIHTIALEAPHINTIYEDENLQSKNIGRVEDQKNPDVEEGNGSVFSSDGCYRAVITNEGFIKVMHTGSAIPISILKSGGEKGLCTFSSSGKFLAFTNNEDQVLIWNWYEKGSVPVIFSYKGHPTAFAFSKDDEIFILADSNNEIHIWQWKAGIKEPVLTLHHEKTITTISLSPDQQDLLTLSDEPGARIWDRTTGVLARNFLHKGDVLAATFDCESRYVATASADWTAGIWNAATGEKIAQLPHDGRVTAVAFSKDGKYLATACDDFVLRIWQWKLSDLKKEAKIRLTGNLMPEDWKEYIGDEPYQEIFNDLGWRDLPPKDPFEQ
ncbi:WD40 repeat domain-containing protein [Tengunoibacter tsumagoiensis]|uniref:Novel STAND NTPase 1 domain-containing protein n=1 Tax=Tengunoibacter tsumagoiensis TaxID=2014871 RepID=A0A402A097_9CHLR|nr:WD40 repeat domain-containing protein [Tengunoibacter tsumagoiensis]GCE12489.1 hypothetical protein KTT_23480 [Tengunoibacter tsumagoiensis]